MLLNFEERLSNSFANFKNLLSFSCLKWKCFWAKELSADTTKDTYNLIIEYQNRDAYLKSVFFGVDISTDANMAASQSKKLKKFSNFWRYFENFSKPIQAIHAILYLTMSLPRFTWVENALSSIRSLLEIFHTRFPTKNSPKLGPTWRLIAPQSNNTHEIFLFAVVLYSQP